jgi:hypothetical protein
MKKQSDLPEPVPVVTTKLCRWAAFSDRLLLMAVESQRFTSSPEDLACIGVKRTFGDQFVDCPPARSAG